MSVIQGEESGGRGIFELLSRQHGEVVFRPAAPQDALTLSNSLIIQNDMATKGLRDSLRALRKKFLTGYVGSSLADPVPESVVEAFERKHSIELPPEYRYFLTIIGNGSNEMFPLGKMEGEGSFETYLGQLDAAFPFNAPWNDYERQPAFDSVRANDPAWVEEYERNQTAFAEKYCFALNGAIPISTWGCAIWVLLVITGPERGNVWIDDRANGNGIFPLQDTPRSDRLTFLE